ncbi:MAG: DUF4276 family protein [Polyangiaceae bacterium]|jgi:hypothetical protein|nr:DUF4276 family protein [Polyangiaceae bacterium]
MRKVLVLVEGQTEETFVRDVLAPYLLEGFSKSVVPKILVTKRAKSGAQFKGGVSSYYRVKGDLDRLLGDSSAATVTTMLDYYALPADFPGRAGLPAGADPYQKVQALEAAFRADVVNARFLPYFSLHEFEALLFVDPASASRVYGDERRIVQALEGVRDRFDGKPELIDGHPSTAPSKRIEGAFPSYQKPLHGPLAAAAAGLAKLRAACPHFDAWVTALES